MDDSQCFSSPAWSSLGLLGLIHLLRSSTKQIQEQIHIKVCDQLTKLFHSVGLPSQWLCSCLTFKQSCKAELCHHLSWWSLAVSFQKLERCCSCATYFVSIRNRIIKTEENWLLMLLKVCLERRSLWRVFFTLHYWTNIYEENNNTTWCCWII